MLPTAGLSRRLISGHIHSESRHFPHGELSRGSFFEVETRPRCAAPGAAVTAESGRGDGWRDKGRSEGNRAGGMAKYAGKKAVCGAHHGLLKTDEGNQRFRRLEILRRAEGHRWHSVDRILNADVHFLNVLLLWPVSRRLARGLGGAEERNIGRHSRDHLEEGARVR